MDIGQIGKLKEAKVLRARQQKFVKNPSFFKLEAFVSRVLLKELLAMPEKIRNKKSCLLSDAL